MNMKEFSDDEVDELSNKVASQLKKVVTVEYVNGRRVEKSSVDGFKFLVKVGTELGWDFKISSLNKYSTENATADERVFLAMLPKPRKPLVARPHVPPVIPSIKI